MTQTDIYYLVIKKLQNKNKKQPLLVEDDDGKLAGNDEEKARLIAEHFERALAPIGAETNKKYQPHAQ